MRRPLLCCLLVALAAPVGIASAAPFDGPRWQEFGGQHVPMFEVPGALSVTFAPGTLESWPGDAPLVGPPSLVVEGVTLRQVGRRLAPRHMTEEYRATTELSVAATRRVARALALLPGVQAAAPLWSTSQTDLADPWASTDVVLVRLRSDDAADVAALQDAAARMGLHHVVLRGAAPFQWRASLPAAATVDALEASMRLAELSAVEWAEADWLIPTFERFTPNDEYFPDQWHLVNTGQIGGTPGNDVKATLAWDLTLGDASVIVAAQDSGVDLDHPDLLASLLLGYDFVDGDADPSPSGSHGTSVAGCMAAPDNGLGVVGVCPRCRILPVRVIGASSSGQADAHDFSVASGAAVINNSWGPSDTADPGTAQPIPDVVATAIDAARTTGRDGKGVPVFWAAGNGANNGQTCTQDGYAAYEGAIAVGASNNLGSRSSYSETCAELDLSAPSNGGTASIVTTRIDSYSSTFGGTSAASPNAAGVAALVLSALPELTEVELRQLLTNTADRIDTVGGSYDAQGHSDAYGAGRVDALAALLGQVAVLTVPEGAVSCDETLPVSLSIPTSPGLGTVTVTARSDRETTPETFVLTEGDPGVYTGAIGLIDGAAVAGDGLISVGDGGSVTVASDDSGTERSVAVDCQGPILSGFEVSQITWDSAVLFWETNEPADGVATWDGGGNGDAVVDLDHLVIALDLLPCTNYSASLSSTDGAGLTNSVDNAIAWRTRGDPSVVPDGAPDDADPCDPSTWVPDEPTPADDDDSTTAPRDPGGFQGNGGCSDCKSATGPAGSPRSALWLTGLVVLARRRTRPRP